jgi:hypothetical protein
MALPRQPNSIGGGVRNRDAALHPQEAQSNIAHSIIGGVDKKLLINSL